MGAAMIRMVGRLACLAAILAAGPACSRQVKLGQLSGKVTFNGKPVPAGYVSFMPEASAGNLGKVKVAQIKDGVYDTAVESDPGISPGPTVIRIAGFDGKKQKGFSQGKQIFNPHELRATLAEGISTMDFQVPASAAANLQIVPTSDEP
jgi:hypothetical protein